MARKLQKFMLLMWKNWLIQRRHISQTAIEILAPVFFSALLVLIRSLVKIENHEMPTTFKNIDIPPDTYRIIVSNVSIKLNVLAYSPNNELIESTMGHAANFFYPKPAITRGFKNSRQLAHYLARNYTQALCGIEFPDSLANADHFPENIDVKIRFPGESRKLPDSLGAPLNWRTNLLFPIYQTPGPRVENADDGGYPAGYLNERFITVQHHVSMAIINHFRDSESNELNQTRQSSAHFRHIPDALNMTPKIFIQRYPYPPYIEDPLLQALTGFISMVIMLSFVYTCINTVKVITNEKEKQVKEVMKIMGLPNWLHWLAWFIKSFMFMLIAVILVTVLLKVHWLPGAKVSVFTNSDATVIFVFLCLYMVTTIMFCFMISSFFSRANTAATIAGLFWFLSYTPYMFLQNKYETLSLGVKLVMCLGSNSAMAFGFQFMLMFEGTSEGLQWGTVWKRVTPDDSFLLGHVMIVLVIDAIIYFLITLYVEALFPGDYGVPKPWYFPVTRTYWCGARRHGNGSVEDSSNGDQQHADSDIMEKEPNMYAGIQIKHLRKVFKNKKVAVRGLNLNMYEDQITALLGHNGAGKTTTMSMLTGIYPPSNGTAIVAGYDIWTDMSKVRASLGLCPQHNVLFDDLTVKEHLYFFGKLKGLHSNEIAKEIEKYINLLELVPKANSRAGTLSGGMKRKLSVGIALCGNSKVVMLDEPTAGMDPAARRAIWDILQVEKKGRTMLLTTHFMDEADLLGDRIAIMAGGTLQCCGSSFFLKKKYGAGYQLTLEKSSKCNVMKITELLRKYIPNIQVDTNVGSELTYRLNEELLSVFENMLRDLEENAEILGVLNYGISLTTLEEVFMRVGADHGQEEKENALEMNGKLVHDINETNGDLEFNRRHSSESRLDLGDNLLTGFDLYKNQFKAMLMKKAYSTLRSWVLTFIQLILPVTFLIIAILIVRTMKANRDLPPLDISLSSYAEPITVMDGNHTYSQEYKEFVKNELKQTMVDLNNNQNISDYVLQRAKENLPVVRQRFIVGATFAKDYIISWFNNIPFHSLPLSLNLVHNAILRKYVGKNHTIRITNSPLPYTLDTKMQQLQDTNGTGFQLAFNIGFSMAFVASFYILFCVRERVSKAKHLQFVSGVNVLTFWISSYLFDFIHFLITSIFLIVTLAAFQEEGFRTFPELGRIFSCLILFGFAMLPLTYLASFFFSIPSSGYTIMTFINIFTGCFGFLIVVILRFPQLELEYIADGLDWFFLLIPHYSICSSIYSLNVKYSALKFCQMLASQSGNDIYIQTICHIKKQCCDMQEDYYSWEREGIGRNIFFFCLVGVVSFIILIVIEYRLPQKIMYKFQSEAAAPPNAPDEDDDVANERHKIQNATQSDINHHCLMLRDFSKYYKKFLAVNKLSVGIKRSECFGLLGINGAGKTSTFKMLTGDETISYGDAWVNGMSLKTDMKRVHQIIGYCPQFDALLDNLTGRETMTLFCLLRGVPLKETRFMCEKLAREFHFQRHIDKKVKEYSGGNKRKLSTAVALIGDPCVVYLDEPSTGMDPAAKRHLWNGLCKVRDSGKCIVLTSHSMEECEALCTRLAIMVNGNFKCLGSTQHLKSKFSEGYTLILKVRKGNTNMDISSAEIRPIDDYIKQNFPTAILREKYQELLTYYIPQTNIPWSRMFGLMEKGKQILNIEDYSLGQSSLEQV